MTTGCAKADLAFCSHFAVSFLCQRLTLAIIDGPFQVVTLETLQGLFGLVLQAIAPNQYCRMPYGGDHHCDSFQVTMHACSLT